MERNPADITGLLRLAVAGDADAHSDVFSAIYQELRRLARSQRARHRSGQTMNTTALVHEAYMRLASREGPIWENRRHFFATAAVAMRNILVDEARRRGSQKRGGDQIRIELNDSPELLELPPEDVAALDAALTKLEAEHPEDFQVAMLRYFTGMSAAEIGEMYEQSERTIQRRWRFCRSWLDRELRA